MLSYDVTQPLTSMVLVKVLQNYMKFSASSLLRKQAKVFNSQSASLEVLCNAGEKILVNLYNGKPIESLNSFSFCGKVASGMPHIKTQILPQQLQQQKRFTCLLSDSAMEVLYGET